MSARRWARQSIAVQACRASLQDELAKDLM